MSAIRNMLDQGHGRPGVGNEHGGIVEADYVYELGRQAIPVLDAAGFDAAVIRDRDEHPDFAERQQRIRDHGSALVIQLHVNAGIDSDGVLRPSWRGCHVFHCAGNGRTEIIAREIEAAMPEELRRRSKGVVGLMPERDSDWGRAAHCVYAYREDTVLVEFGYSTNPQDAAILRLKTTPPRLVAALLAGVAKAAQVYGR